VYSRTRGRRRVSDVSGEASLAVGAGGAEMEDGPAIALVLFMSGTRRGDKDRDTDE